MRTQNSDTGALIAALQGDLPSAEDDARIRAKLAAAGACVGATVVGAAALHAASVNAAAGSAVLGGATQGAQVLAGVKTTSLLSTLASAIPLGSVGVKTLVVAGALVTGVSYPLVAPKLASVFHQESPAQPPTAKTQAPVFSGRQTQSSPADEAGPANPTRVADKTGAEDESRNGPGEHLAGLQNVDAREERRPSLAAGKPMKDGALRGALGMSREADTATKTTSISNTSSAGLAEETQLIERALRAQLAGDKAAARNWLNVHRERFPEGNLTIERKRLWAALQD